MLPSKFYKQDVKSAIALTIKNPEIHLAICQFTRSSSRPRLYSEKDSNKQLQQAVSTFLSTHVVLDKEQFKVLCHAFLEAVILKNRFKCIENHYFTLWDLLGWVSNACKSACQNVVFIFFSSFCFLFCF